MESADAGKVAMDPLRARVAALLASAPVERVEGRIVAVIVPDADSPAGGEVAAAVYRRLEDQTYQSVIFVVPSREGRFGRIHVAGGDTYHTASGNVKVSDELRNELCDEEDDIFIDDRGHTQFSGIGVQLPFLEAVLEGPFDAVPIVMGEETPDFCRELGYALGEVMYNRQTLLVATANLLEGEREGLDAFTQAFESGDVERLMGIVQGETVHVEGRGPVVVALIAAQRQRANRFQILTIRAPSNDQAGFFGAVLWAE